MTQPTVGHTMVDFNWGWEYQVPPSIHPEPRLDEDQDHHVFSPTNPVGCVEPLVKNGVEYVIDH